MQISGKVITVTVTTTDGQTTKHIYPPSSKEERIKTLATVIRNITDALDGSSPFIILLHPFVGYKTDQIIRITFEPDDFITQDERYIGYLQPRESNS